MMEASMLCDDTVVLIGQSATETLSSMLDISRAAASCLKYGKCLIKIIDRIVAAGLGS